MSAKIPQVLFGKTESWVKPIEIVAEGETNIEGSVRYLLFDNQIDIRSSLERRFFHYSIQPQTEQGLKNVSQVEVRFSPKYENLVFHDIQVFRNGKRVNKLDESKLKVFQQEDQLAENLYSENWTALFILEDIRVGDVLEYSYSISGSNPVFGEQNFGSSPLSWSVPVEKTNFRLISNVENKLRVDVHNSTKTVTKKTIGDVNEYVLTQADVKAVREDDYAPRWFMPYSYITYSQYDGWKEVNDWATDLYSLDLTLPEELIGIIEQHKKNNLQESVATMIQWVQDNIRYFGIEMGVNSHLPSLPLETFNRRYGDCKDKAILLIAVLKHFNIDAFPVLVSSSISKALPDETPSPGAFDHVIITFDIDGKKYWVDATSSNQRGRLDDMSFPNLYWGLVVKKGTTKLTEILPNDDKQLRGSIDVLQKLRVSKDNGESAFTVNTKYSGWQAEQFRSYINEVGTQISSEDHLDYFAKYFPEIKVKSPLVVTDSGDDNNISVNEVYTVNGVAKAHKNNNQLLVYANQILDNIWLPDIRQRQAPFVLPFFLDVNIEIQIETEDSRDVVWFDSSTETVAENKWFEYTRNIEKKENVIVIKYHYKSLLSEVSSDEFSQYASLLEGIENSLTYKLLLRNHSLVRDNNARAKRLVNMLMNKNKGN